MGKKDKKRLRAKRREARLVESLGNPCYFHRQYELAQKEIDDAESPARAAEEAQQEVIRAQEQQRQEIERETERHEAERRRVRGGYEAAAYL